MLITNRARALCMNQVTVNYKQCQNTVNESDNSSLQAVLEVLRTLLMNQVTVNYKQCQNSVNESGNR